MTTELAVEVPAVAGPQPRHYSARLFGGFIGRSWLWFLGGCLVVTLLPLLFGWRPYVVESGSMAPRIKVGDVILASPEHDSKKLLGHVTVFHDPDAARAGTIKSHRVVTINADGTLTTKGDANPTVDPVHLKVDGVVGIGRLLVRWVGLPLIWVQHGAWVKLGLFAVSIWIGALLVMRDIDPETTDTDTTGTDPTDGDTTDPMDADLDRDDEQDDERDDAVPAPSAKRSLRSRLRPVSPQTTLTGSNEAPANEARSVPKPAARHPFAKMARRGGTAGLTALCLLLPTTRAAFSVTTKDNTNKWSVGTFSYTTETKNLGPYLYWKLDEANGTLANDSSANNHDGTYTSTWGMHTVGPITDDTTNLNFGVTPGNATAPGTNPSCIYTAGGTGMAAPGPTTYSEIIWFKTTSTKGGKLIGLENTRNTVSDNSNGGQYDRMLYMDATGEIYFGVYTTTENVAHSAAGLNDGNWHMAAATMSTTAGMSLYIDGKLVGTNPNTVSETETRASYWRVGCGNLDGWNIDWNGANAPATNTNYPFNGSLDEATVYLNTLTATQIAFLYFAH